MRLTPLDAATCQFCPAGEREHCLHQQVVVPTGTILATARSKANCAWLLRTGLVLVTEPMTGDCSAATPGALVGLDCLLGEHRLCNAVTIMPSTLCLLPRDVLVSFLASHPESLRTIGDAAIEDPAVTRRLDSL